MPHGARAGRSAEVTKKIRCQVCELLVEEAQSQYAGLGTKRGNRDAIGDFVERLCTLQTREGRWLRYLDIVGERELSVQKHPEPGECRQECIALKAACRQ